MGRRGYVGARRIGSKTMCGVSPRAKVIARVGNKLTYRFPCGYEQTEVLMHGKGKQRKPADEWLLNFFGRYWGDGVTYQCPKCLRDERKKQKEVSDD